MQTWHWLVLAVIGAWVIFRMKGLSDMNVPYDLGFKHPFTSPEVLRGTLVK